MFYCAMPTAVPPRERCKTQCPHCIAITTKECPICNGEGAIGTGVSNSFVDPSDAMSCPECGGTGKVNK